MPSRGAIRRWALRLVSLLRPGRAEVDLSREIEAHLLLLQDQFVTQSLSPDEARLAAKRAFGGVDQAKERHRDARSSRWLVGWWPDLKLGSRMLLKYPGLTLVGGAAMAFGIAVGTAGFEVLSQS